MPPLVHLGSTFTKILSVIISSVSGNLNDRDGPCGPY